MKTLVITGILATTLLMSGCMHHRARGHGGRGYNNGHGGYIERGNVVYDEHGNAVVYDEHGNAVVYDGH